MSSSGRSTSQDDVRAHINSSLFARRGPDGTPDETLIGFLKIYEIEADGGSKTRYLILAVSKSGKVVIHKAKRNSNLSFSKGKTWNMEDIRVLEVISPSEFALTMTSRRYRWSTERPKDQTNFLSTIARVYRSYTNGRLPELINFSPPPQQGPPQSQAQQLSPAVASPLSEPPPSAFPVPRMGPGDLAPPQFLARTERSGSFSSLNSANTQNSNYPPTAGRPSIDDERSPPSSAGAGAFNRMPDPVRRPSGDSMPSPRVTPGQPLGMGPPPAQRKMSDDRADKLRPSNLRNVSAASEYEQGGNEGVRMRKTESDLGVVPEAEGYQIPPASTRREQRPPAPAPPAIREPSPPPEAAPAPKQKALAPPKIMTTDLSAPSQSSSALSPSSATSATRSRRASFHPPPLDTTIARDVLLQGRTGLLPGAASMTIDDTEGGDDAVLKNVEEMLEGFDWGFGAGAMGGSLERRKKGADAIEGRLLDELLALESANIHAFLESDDRTAQVLGHIDEALMDLEDIDIQITGYRMQLNAVSEDISYIESQGKGLQVQTSNQQALLNELRQLLQIVEVPPSDLQILAQESPSTDRGVKSLESAAASLYKALQAGMDSANAEVAATIARMQEYRTQSDAFSKRISDYLDVTFRYQSDSTLAEFRKQSTKGALAPHQTMGEYLMGYTGLVLYVKEMDEARYQKLCSNYMSTISQLHQAEMKDLLMGFMTTLNATAGDAGSDAAFSATGYSTTRPSALQKSKTVIGRGLHGDRSAAKQERRGDSSGTKRASELYNQALTEIINQVVIEEDFINAFLHLTDTDSTFADYMELDSYFRRQAARHASKGMSQGMMQLVRSMMDLIFGFVELELKQWVEAAVERGPVTVVGIIGVTERIAREAADENTSMFFTSLFEKQLVKQRMMLDAFTNDQIRAIVASKQTLTVKKRKGVTFFIKHFPVFVERVESQMEGFDDLPIRERVNNMYDSIVETIFNALQQLAKMDRADGQATEDKGQLNYHVIMIENMYHFVEDVSQLFCPPLVVFLQRAQNLYQENLTTYIRMLMRRSFARFMDFFDGVERLLKSTPANEVSLHQSYNRSALKKVLKEHGAKDMRKAVETMSRRVDKHFSDEDDPVASSAANAVLIGAVWKEVTKELAKDVLKAQGIVARSYAESGLGLEFSSADVEATCKKMKG
ncbi:hypothetical protein L202_06031 [Cryptococcus amylolentus CBS 6039]|uniref:Exocyst complex component Sec3 PIP2-binding N-terminal domain-containing protein n=2 Tax=Cryptococcus amylolentus TaxID=104669 RepID=A0A1E3HID7_9TREE|nr:hypothetical protein L202_06031 [Cryptococcus amylolentus CBS 6039]ODN76094.1 hypothetical protein L202_06031 [Cryptococcus amylolentus CBS 6039]ODN97187.1 hypothetical protein I350_08167 [Cryptococcus amylolentus CBS 6273]